jgi:hypothetical protein
MLPNAADAQVVPAIKGGGSQINVYGTYTLVKTDFNSTLDYPPGNTVPDNFGIWETTTIHRGFSPGSPAFTSTPSSSPILSTSAFSSGYGERKPALQILLARLFRLICLGQRGEVFQISPQRNEIWDTFLRGDLDNLSSVMSS